MLAGNVSSGIEPVFDFSYRRRILQPDGSARESLVEDYAHALYQRIHGAPPPAGGAFVAAPAITPRDHLAMQAAIQRHVDSSISKTINCPADLPFEAFEGLYLEAYDRGLKGCTTFRPNAVTGSVLTAAPATAPSSAPQVQPSSTNQYPGVPKSVAVQATMRQASTGGGVTETGSVVYMAKPLEREPILQGFTYKLSWPNQNNALYITINDMERGGRRCPFEIFINTKNLDHYAWTVALTRMISAIFRRGGDVSFVAEELKAIFDPQGGRWMDGHYVPSLLAAIGNIIELHMHKIGFLKPDDFGSASRQAVGGEATIDDPANVHGTAPHGLRIASTPSTSSLDTPSITVQPGMAVMPLTEAAVPDQAAPSRHQITGGRSCPHCSQPSLIRIEGCWSCGSCGYAHCD